MNSPIIIPVESLQSETLQRIVEEFISREGTEYGHHEYELEKKVAQVRAQLTKGEVLLVFDPESESCTLMTKHAYSQNVKL